MRAGDLIRHIPTQIKTTVVYNDGYEIIPSHDLKWLKFSDCEVIRCCTDEEHERFLQEWANSSTNDLRKTRCLAKLST